MIIDSHVHIGTWGRFYKSINKVLESLEKYHIDFALISSCDGVEYTEKGNNLPFFLKRNQISINKDVVKLCKKYPNKFKGLFWCRPSLEGYSEKVESFIKDNREYIVGLKFHPYYSKMRMTDIKIIPYIKLAEQLDIPVLVHTARDQYSDAKYTYELAKRFPKVKFILAHMQLDNNTHRDAIKYMKELPNLYGDTAWVHPGALKEIIKALGSDRILFGSDNPIDGVDTYNHEWYQFIFNELDESHRNNILFNNIIRLYKLNF